MTEVADLRAQLPAELDGSPHGGRLTAGLGLTLLEVGLTKARARARVGPQHHQEAGILHGGWHASAVETIGRLGAHMRAAEQEQSVVGVSNHTEFRQFPQGELDIEALPVHQGRTQQVWEVRITRDDGKVVARDQVRLAHTDR